jgi:ADP-ribosylglycohydrolase
MNEPTRSDRILGCLLGGAFGDALGAPIEFWGSERVGRDCVRGSFTEQFLPTHYGDDLGLVTDDTQMTLFTLDALLRWRDDPTLDLVQELHSWYLHWWDTQRLASPPDGATGLASQQWLYARRAPGTTCSSALAAARASGKLGEPAANDSKGCGGVMRAAPFGLLGLKDPGDLAARAAGLTHGHAVGQVSAGALAVIIDRILFGEPLTTAVQTAITWSEGAGDDGETATALRTAVDLADSGKPPSQRLVESLGGAWVGEEAIAISAYCALAFSQPTQFAQALELAVLHGGDSDSTGAITGNILGALHGAQALPPMSRQVEGFDSICDLAARAVLESDVDRQSGGAG